MSSILVIAGDSRTIEPVCAALRQHGFDCTLASDEEQVTVCMTRQMPSLVLAEIDSGSPAQGIARKLKQEHSIPVIALLREDLLTSVNGYLDSADDFIVEPYDPAELALRIRRILHESTHEKTGNVITCGELIINPDRYEVSVAGHPVELTFREYQLLSFLAGNKGRVLTRDTLLNKVWGYDYYGGDRTVDVHIRRLRSKIEDQGRVFLETVRNIGYRFKAQ